jgi:hypothetical protein
MHIICPGCGATFKRSGWANHIRQSKHPNCQLHTHRHLDDLDLRVRNASDDKPPASAPVSGPPVMDGPPEQHWLGIDTAGDIFGDYSSYTAADFGIDDRGDSEQEMSEPFEDDDPKSLAEAQEDEIVEYDTLLTEGEHQLEPERPFQTPGNPDQGQMQDILHSHHPFRLRGGFEDPLANHPEIIKFSAGNVGAVYEQNQLNGNVSYRRSVSNADDPNPYRPFTSKLDWEIARWAKTRGPGSSALTELLSIEGVSFHAYEKYFGGLLM